MTWIFYASCNGLFIVELKSGKASVAGFVKNARILYELSCCFNILTFPMTH